VILFMVGGARCGSGRYPYTILDSAVFDAHRSWSAPAAGRRRRRVAHARVSTGGSHRHDEGMTKNERIRLTQYAAKSGW